jgi:hypothetical protein
MLHDRPHHAVGVTSPFVGLRPVRAHEGSVITLASNQRCSSDGRGLLLLAVEDVQVDGVRLEGVGVAPTIEVQAGPTSAGEADPQLSRAVALLSA